MSTRRYVVMVAVVAVSGLVGGAVATRVLGGEVAFAQGVPKVEKVVTAEGFSLVDKDGKVRGSLSLDAEGTPSLSLLDKEGKVRVLLRLDAGGSPGLEFKDEGEKVRAAMGTTEITHRRTEEITKRPTASFVLFDKQGGVSWAAP